MSLNTWSLEAGRMIATALAELLGIPVPAAAYLAFAVQARRETAGGTQMAAANNPLNLRPILGGWPGQIGTTPANFAVFGSLEAGCWACARNYDNPDYAGVLSAFRGGDPVAMAYAIEESPWDEGHYGGTLHIEVEEEVMATEFVTKADLEAYKQTLQDELDMNYATKLHSHPGAPVPEHTHTGPVTTTGTVTVK
jgi:hypothetical protein